MLSALVLTQVLSTTGPARAYHNGAAFRCPEGTSFPAGGRQRWTRLPSPVEDTTQPIGHYAVDPFDPKRIYQTIGDSLFYSTDGACTWLTGGSPLPATMGIRPRIAQLVIPDPLRYPELVWLLVHDQATFLTSLVPSKDGGETWDSSGFRTVSRSGTPRELVVSPSDPDRAYVLFDLPISQDVVADLPGELDRSVIYMTEDLGNRWSEVRQPGDNVSELTAPTLPIVSDFDIDPLDPDTLWAVGERGVFRSRDGGLTWRLLKASTSNSKVPTVVTAAPGNAAAVFYHAPVDPFVEVTGDGGRTWTHHPTPGAVFSAAFRQPGQLVIAAEEGVFVGPPEAWTQIRFPINGENFTFQDPPLVKISVARDPGRTIFGSASDSSAAVDPYELLGIPVPNTAPVAPLEDYTFPAAGALAPPVRDATDDPGLGVPEDRLNPNCIDPKIGRTPPRPDPARLTPSQLDVVLAPGQTKTIDYRLTIPPRGVTPIDLYFLIDASMSMDPSLCGAAHSATQIANTLQGKRGLDVFFGAGTYQDLPPAVAGCYPYRKDHEMSPLSRAFGEALRSAQTCGGSEPQMTALYETAKGTGGYGGLGPAGQDAHFREDANPVIVHISDEPLTVGPPHRTIAEAILALKEEGIHQVGITPSEDDLAALTWLREVARGTDTLAGASGADCDGDGAVDVRPGEPLACAVDLANDRRRGGALAEPVTELILGLIEDEVGPAELLELSDSGVIGKITPGLYPALDFSSTNRLKFQVEYICDAGMLGQTAQVRLGGKVVGSVAARAVANVYCGVAPAVPPLPAAGLPLVPPGPPPPPIAQPQPQPQPQTQAQAQPQPQPQPQPQAQPQAQAQSQSQSQAQTGLVAQEQEQPQVAFVHAAQQLQERTGMELAMVRQKPGAERARWRALSGLACASVATLYGLALATARQRSFALIRRSEGRRPPARK